MTQTNSNRDTSLPGIFFLALYFLTFFQLLSDLIESTYVFGLLGVSIPPEIAAVLLLLLPLVGLLLPGLLGQRGFAVIVGLGGLLCRGASLALDTRGRMLASGLGAGLLLLFLAALFVQMARLAREERAPAGQRMGVGLAFAVLLLVLLRAGNHGNDLASFTGQYSTGYLLVLAAVLYLGQWARNAARAPDTTRTARAGQGEPGEPRASTGLWRALASGVGLFSALLLLYFGLSSPAVITRWTEANYPTVTLLLAGSAAAWVGLWSALPGLRARLTAPRALEIWNGLFVIALAMLLRAHSVSFPADPSPYPLLAPAPGPLAVVTLAMVLLLHPVIYVDFALLAQALVDGLASWRSGLRLAALAVSVGAIWLLKMSFAHVFTTVYDYIPVIGPLFRDRFWLVYTIAGLGMALPVLLLRRPVEHAEQPEQPLRAGIFAFYAGAIFVAAAAAVLRASPVPEPPPAPQTLRVLTYNIQQGYTDGGARGFDAQLGLIQRLEPDIIGLQESDTARIAGGNADVVRYYAEKLNLFSYYGPSTVTGTFGIALLSRYPIEDPRVVYLYSEGEQTAAILARIRAGGQAFTVLVTHLGNDGPQIQQEQVLQALQTLRPDAAPNVIAMGDFNFKPGSPQYFLTLGSYQDAWTQAETRLMDPPDLAPEDKIDHIFVTPGTRVRRAEYLGPGPSDHPAMFAEIDLTPAAAVTPPATIPQENAMLNHYFFDDFAYADKDAMRANGWILRDAPGWPGVPGAVWSSDHIALIDDPERQGGRLVQMTSATEGVEAGSRQAQLCHCRKYFEGTYASRVRFLDQPVSGPGGDEIVTTFYQISPSRFDMDLDYSEMDFEYLPNGGWGHTGPTMFVTSWETFQLEPWKALNQSSTTSQSFEGWHTLVLQVMDGKIRYFANGKLLGEHSGSVYPRIPMAMSYNLWFIRGGLAAPGATREYRQWIDWTFYADKALLTPEEVEIEIHRLRKAGQAYHDSVEPGDPPLDSPCNF